MLLSNKQKPKALIRLLRCACWSAPLLFTTHNSILVFLCDIFLSVYSILKETSVCNSGKPDQTPRFAASDLVLHCLLMALIWVNTLYQLVTPLCVVLQSLSTYHTIFYWGLHCFSWVPPYRQRSTSSLFDQHSRKNLLVHKC